MARLTPFSRLLIALLIVAGVYFAARHFLPQYFGGSSETVTNTTSTSATSSTDEGNSGNYNSGNSTGSTAAAAPSGISFNRNPFTFKPSAPINGKLKGVVELGATGFNSFIVRIDANKNWKLEKAEFGASLVNEGMATDADIKQGLKQYIANMIGYGVGGRDIHFVISSGAKKVDITEKIIAALKTLGYQVNTVTPEQEGQYALRSVLPAEYSGRAFVVDIGSGNTKISWRERGEIKALETYGSKYFQNGLNADAVFNDAKSKARTVPSHLTDVCFVIGGVPFELAKELRSSKDERYTVLKSPAESNPKGEKQIAGVNIYNAIAQGTGCKQFVFDWDANFTIGFLLNL